MPKKSPAQLDREIAQVLSRKAARAHASKRRSGGGKQQEKLLADANAAGLAREFTRAEEILKKGPQRAIATSYSTITPESAEGHDFADRGWVDEEGDPIEISGDDIEEQLDAGSRAPATDAIVTQAARWLRDNGAIEASSSSFNPGVWYSQEFTVSNYGTGEERSEDFFLRNFTPEEEKKIFEAFHRRRR